MTGMDVRLSPEGDRFLVKMAKECPREVRRALGLAAGIVRSRMRREMRGGKKSRLSPWSDLTRRIRAVQAQDWAKTFGGRLVYPKAKQIAIIPRGGDALRIGWIGPFEPAVIKFQDGGAALLPRGFRRQLYKTGKFNGEKLPETSSQPPRQVVDPVAEESRGQFEHWVAGCLKRVLDNSIKGAERGYVRATTNSQRLRYARQAARGYATLVHGDIQELERRGAL